MDGFGLLASASTDSMVTGLKVFVVGFLGVVFCMSLLTLALKTAMVLVSRLEKARLLKPKGPTTGASAPAAKSTTAPSAASAETKKVA